MNKIIALYQLNGLCHRPDKYVFCNLIERDKILSRYRGDKPLHPRRLLTTEMYYNNEKHNFTPFKLEFIYD